MSLTTSEDQNIISILGLEWADAKHIHIFYDAVELMLLNCGVGEDSCESLGLQEDPTSPS